MRNYEPGDDIGAYVIAQIRAIQNLGHGVSSTIITQKDQIRESGVRSAMQQAIHLIGETKPLNHVLLYVFLDDFKNT